MSRNYIEYNQYLGARRCCDLKVQGPEGPIGPTGPAAIGPQGNTGSTGSGFTGPTGRSCKGPTGDPGPVQINTSVIALPLLEPANTIVVPAQTLPIQYYSLNLALGSSNPLTGITFTSLPAGYQAIIFINGNDSQTHLISCPMPGINFINYNTSKTLTQSPGTPKAVLTAYSDGTNIYGNLVLMY